MAALSEAARKERSNLIFGQEPRDLRTGSTSSIFGKDIILAVEYNLLNLSGRDSIKNSIHIVAEKLIDIGLFESKKNKGVIFCGHAFLMAMCLLNGHMNCRPSRGSDN